MSLLFRVHAMNCMKKINVFVARNSTANSSRRICNSLVLNSKSHQESKSCHENINWNRIYYFPYIRSARILQRLKIYQTIATVVAVPISMTMFKHGMMDLGRVEFVMGIAMLASVTFYFITSFFQKLIGIVAIAENQKIVKISHLTFWGHKNDIVVPIEDLIPLTEGNCNANDFYVKLQRYNSDENLYISLQYGKIIDRDKFELVFGNLDILGLKK